MCRPRGRAGPGERDRDPDRRPRRPHNNVRLYAPGPWNVRRACTRRAARGGHGCSKLDAGQTKYNHFMRLTLYQYHARTVVNSQNEINPNCILLRGECEAYWVHTNKRHSDLPRPTPELEGVERAYVELW